MKRPRCPKCEGLLIPGHVPGVHRVVNVKCVNCGNNIYREFEIRKPNASEKSQMGGPGVAYHSGSRG